ncbi:hypothetical protein H7F51_12995 [Novosphingobium flavum]|uniref:Uncharacterized protein n=1 Tax=Novosphingobium flavum TaxID=1778672 RepID=A0A7X1FT09_9SPHN|nr:hypothetical protein [Novosphingobium flavum]MBC2666439.1 hypothetical protein [Novosphingobium flavum]
MRRFIIPLALFALTVPQVAAAAEPPCLTTGEFTALTTYALPSAIGSVTRGCTASLPTSAWLPRNGPALAQRYAAGKVDAWPAAKAAFIKLSEATNPEAAQLFVAMPDESLMPLADAALAGIISAKVKPDSCPVIDRALSLLAPLPAENTAGLIALAVGLGAKTSEPRLGKIAICKA